MDSYIGSAPQFPHDETFFDSPPAPSTRPPTPIVPKRTLPTPLWEDFDAAAERHAQSGWVCVGPAGRPVSEQDRLIFGMLVQEKPGEVGDWFQRACRHRLFDVKVRVPAMEEDRPLYVVFRGAGTGPGIYSKWEELTDVVLGFHGSLYQKCSGWLDACSRMMQAMAIEGLVSHLPQSARHTPDIVTWMTALTTTPRVKVHVTDGLLPSPTGGATPPVVDDHRQWRTFDVGQKHALAYEEVVVHSLTPRPRRLTVQAEQQRHPEPPSRRPSGAAHASQSPSLSAVGVVPGRSSPDDADEDEDDDDRLAGPGDVSRPFVRGYWVVVHGRAPWIYNNLRELHAMTMSCPCYIQWLPDFASAVEYLRRAVQQDDVYPTWVKVATGTLP